MRFPGGPAEFNDKRRRRFGETDAYEIGLAGSKDRSFKGAGIPDLEASIAHLRKPVGTNAPRLKACALKKGPVIALGKEVVSEGHPHEDNLHLYVLGRLTATEIEALERHVFNCPACKERIAAITRIVARLNQVPTDRGGSDNRKEPRFRTSDTGFLRSFAPLLPDHWPVQIIDVSKNGLGLVLPTSLAKGSLVQVQVGKIFALGEVRHSTHVDGQRFRVGIRVIDTVGKP